MDFLRFLADYRTPELTSLFGMFTHLGEELISITIICFLYWCYDKQMARKICLSYFASGLLVQALKITFCIPRPWILDRSFQPVSSLQDSATGYSFPSGHTQNSTALFGSLGFLSKKTWQRIVFFLIILGVGFSRMYLGYHTPKDVITSLCIALLFVFFINQILDITSISNKKIALFLSAYSFVILLYALMRKNLSNADLTQFHDCFKAAGAGLGFSLGWYVEPHYINFKEQAVAPFMQAIKLLLGLLLALLLKYGLKALLGTSFTADTLRYFILVCFIMILYPIIIQRYFTQHN
ncbi:MAG: phosphatase PAP2 family protein [Candidatus Galacturonibacter soehngenii]|nr:phosphatase PAP2 family protein [Candidatus Galacturonibacter soehngenii]